MNATQPVKYSFDLAARVADQIARGQRPDREELAAVRRELHPTADPYAPPLGQPEPADAGQYDPPTDADRQFWALQNVDFHSPDSPADDGVSAWDLAALDHFLSELASPERECERLMGLGYAAL